ncbi:MAG: O-antigen ligase family protein [Actinobacteria bacterium]|nr:O-antigen ligase family protein [Actinomycetota bacterium]
MSIKVSGNLSTLVCLWVLVVSVVLPLAYVFRDFLFVPWQASLVLLTFLLLLHRQLRVDVRLSVLGMLLGILFVALLQLLVLQSAEISWPHLSLFVTQVLFLLLGAVVLSREDILQALSVAAGPLVVLESVLIVIQTVFGTSFGNVKNYFGDPNLILVQEWGGEEVRRATGTLASSNAVGTFIALMLPFILYNIDRGYRKSLSYFALAIGVLAILMTVARGSLIAVGIVVVIYYGSYWLQLGELVRRGISSYIYRVALMVVVAAGAMLVAYFYFDVYLAGLYARFTGLVATDETVRANVNALAFRIELIRVGVLIGLENPIWGLGFESTRHVLSQFSDMVPFWWQYPVHNYPVKIFAEMGAVSGVSWLLLNLIAVFRPAKHLDMEGTRPVLAAGIVALFYSSFYLTLLSPELGGVFLLVLLLGWKSR